MTPPQKIYNITLGPKIVKQKCDQQGATNAGTRIQVDLPKLADEALARVSRNIGLFLARFNVLPSTTVSTIFSQTSQEGVTIESVTNAQSDSRNSPVDSEEQYAETLRRRLLLALPPPPPAEKNAPKKREIFVATSFAVAVPNDNSTTSVKVSAILYTADAVTQMSEYGGLLCVDLWRCFNEVPIIRTSSDFEACGLTLSALQSFKWTQYGFKIRKGDGSGDSNREMELGVHLQATSKMIPKLVQLVPEKLVLLLDVCGPSLPFSNLRKTALLETAALTRLVHTGIAESLKKIKQSKGLDECIFLSAKQERRLEIYNHSIPRVATALTKMLRLTPNLHEYFCGRLNVPSEISSYSACTEFLQELLAEAYPRKAVTKVRDKNDVDEEEEDDDDEEENEEDLAENDEGKEMEAGEMDGDGDDEI